MALEKDIYDYYNCYYDEPNSYYILNEVKLFYVKENNSRIIPIKLCLGKKNVYALCFDENELIKKIKENINSDKGQISMKINIKKLKKKTLLKILLKVLKKFMILII